MTQATRTKDLSSLADRNLEVIQVTTMKRYNAMSPEIKKVVEREANLLFKYIADKAVNVSANPYGLYSKKPWRALDKSYAKRKGTTNFWYNTGRLENWLRTTEPSSIFGKPVVRLGAFSRWARGKQRMSIIVNPFPKERVVLDDDIYNRLYAPKHVKLNGSVKNIPNEEDRPIISPALLMLTRRKINRAVTKVIKETLSYG